MIAYQVLTEAAALADFCQQAQHAPYLAIDTEFVRTRTYFAKLGLVQVRAAEQIVLVDTLALSADCLQPLWQLLGDQQRPLVIHAGGEDFEILTQQMGHLPTAVFDSQVAHAFLGNGELIGYAAMVQQYTGVVLDKSQSRTDWLQRPLAVEQLEYAAADVDYLYDIYPSLEHAARQRGLLPLIMAETAEHIQRRAYRPPADLLFWFFGNQWQCRPAQLAVLRSLLRWRQQRAMAADIPLSFVAKDHTLLELARKQPDNLHGLKGITDLSPVTVRYSGEAILAAIREGQQATDVLPQLQRLTDYCHYKAAFAALREAADGVAAGLGIAAGLVASRRQLNDVLHWHWIIPEGVRAQLLAPELLSGWRQPLLGAEIERIMQRFSQS